MACAAFPRWAFTLSYGGGNSWLRDQTQNIEPDPSVAGLTELEQLAGLFIQCRGSYGEFFYTDPDDNTRSKQVLGVGNTVNLIFPLLVGYGTGPFTPNFTMPVSGLNVLTNVYRDNSILDPSFYALEQLPSGLWQIVFNNPVVTAGTISADFSFYYRCRFLDDTMSYSQFAQNLWDVKEVRFESVKP